MASLPALLSSFVMFNVLVFGFEFLQLDLEVWLQLCVKVALGLTVYLLCMLVVFHKQSFFVIKQITTLIKQKSSKK